MDYLSRLARRSQLVLFLALMAGNVLLAVSYCALITFVPLDPVVALVAVLVPASVVTFIFAGWFSDYVLQPLTALWQTILHLSPHEQGIAPPQLESLRFGRELVASLTSQIYQLTSVAAQADALDKKASRDLHHNFIASNLPLPLFVLDATETIVFANDAAAAYIGHAAEDLTGKNVYMVLDMAFPNDDTLDKWLKQVKNRKATAASSWERVRMKVLDDHPTRLFDLAAYYNQGNPDRCETMLVLFDHTKQYSQDEQAVSFIALSVHELRTPLTLLRGYIEAFEEELEPQLTPELRDFMQKMRATAQQLTTFVNNILNVARVDDDQLQLELQEENWADIVQSSVSNLELRAKVRGIVLECTVAPDLPSVGVDRISVHEVLNNLVDNAIKYSGASKVIKIDAHLTQDGLVETTVQDFGLGISRAIMPNLFTKFYRDHRNRAQIGGTGLGLYLSKAIITAHGGNIWVRSTEGKGSTFGFTVVPYAQLAEEMKNSGNGEIVRGAHGWIKNHSLYRR